MVVCTEEDANDGEDDDGEAGYDDAVEDKKWLVWLFLLKNERLGKMEDLPHPCLHYSYDGLHDCG